MSLLRRTLIAVALLLAGAWPAAAREVQVAVAANFAEPGKAIARQFEARTGHRAILSFGASGQVFAQIAKGAPYEVFLSADVDRPLKAEAEGLAVGGSRFTYATGRLVLWSRTPGLVWGDAAVLSTARYQKLAVADPKAAPYGVAAVETLRALGLYDLVSPKIVRGASIAQALQFAETGAAELGFVALSQVIGAKRGSRWLVPPNLHSPIDQQAVLLKTGAANPAAVAFMAFLKGPEARAIVRRYGYQLP